MKTVQYIGLLLTIVSLHYQVDAQLSYAPDVGLRNSIRAEVWNDLKPRTPKPQQALMGLLFINDAIFKEYEKIVKQKGYPTYDLATVQLFFNDVCREISFGKEYTDEETDAHYEAMKSKFEASSMDEALSNKEKQRKYDPLILKAVWVAGLYELTQKGKVAQDLAEQMLKEAELGTPEDVDETTSTTIPEKKSKPKISSTHNPASITDVVMITTTSYGLSGVYISNDVYALYANGDSFFEPSEPLETFDIQESKRNNPNHWDRWQIKNNILYLTDSDDGDTRDWKKWFKVRPAKKGMTFNGKFNTSNPFGGAVVMNASTLFMDHQGRFEWNTTKGGATGWKPIFVNSRTSGTYEVDNRTITFKYGNGVSESFFFGLYPKDDVHFIIGANHFVPRN